MQINTSREQLKISTRVLYDELVKQNAPVQIIDSKNSMLEYEDRQGQKHFLFSTTSDRSSAVGLVIANDKTRSEVIARQLKIPVPEDIVCHTYADVLEFFSLHDLIVLKPVANSGGRGVTTGISTFAELEKAYKFARTYGTKVIAQQHIIGDDIRLLVIAGKFVSAVLRKPAYVIGDGELTIKSLIVQENVSLHRNDDSQSSLMHIEMAAAKRFLGESIFDIPNDGEEVQVVGPGNVSLGGSLHEATHLVTDSMKQDAIKITNTLRLDMCGVDMMWNQATNTYAMIEVNATPGIDIHNDPFSGTSSDAVKTYIEWLLA